MQKQNFAMFMKKGLAISSGAIAKAATCRSGLSICEFRSFESNIAREKIFQKYMKLKIFEKIKSHKSSCKSCNLLHGEHGIICAVHPYGPQTSDCPDHEPVSRWVYAWRVSETSRFFAKGVLDAFLFLTLTLITISSIWSIIESILFHKFSLSEFIQNVRNTAQILGFFVNASALLLLTMMTLMTLYKYRRSSKKDFIYVISLFVSSCIWLFIF
jgi:hypothetical protein